MGRFSIFVIYTVSVVIFLPGKSVQGSRRSENWSNQKKMIAARQVVDQPADIPSSPSVPMHVLAVIDEITSQCNSSYSVDLLSMINAKQCVEENVSIADIKTQINRAIKSNDKQFFVDVCTKWPMVKNCLSGSISLISNCVKEGQVLVKFWDEVVHFWCGRDLSADPIAIFMEEGGTECPDLKAWHSCTSVNGNGMDLRSIFFGHLDSARRYFGARELATWGGSRLNQVCEELGVGRDCALSATNCRTPFPKVILALLFKNIRRKLNCPVMP